MTFTCMSRKNDYCDKMHGVFIVGYKLRCKYFLTIVKYKTCQSWIFMKISAVTATASAANKT